MSVAFADYDDDGFMDVFVTNDAVPNFLFHNRRDGTFEEVGAAGRRGRARRTDGPSRAWAPTSATTTTTAGPTSC